MKKVIVIGGGISGLIASTILARKKIPCLVIEKRNFPQHKVCGEYVSNEVIPFLKSVRLFPDTVSCTRIDRFMLTSVNGNSRTLPLDLGGFGISRYAFDNFLFTEAKKSGVEFLLDTSVERVSFAGSNFHIHAGGKSFEADVVLGAYGKRSNLDVRLNRSFVHHRSPYVGVKYHIRCDHPPDLIALHNFSGGYCGVSNVENDITNLCYLVHRDILRQHKTIKRMEDHVLSVNPHLRKIFSEATFLFEHPETINEISFEEKNAVCNHMLMIGDASGMITPLCGNGMAMAIHAAKIASECIGKFAIGGYANRDEMESEYSSIWKKHFSARLFAGRQIQRLFGSAMASNIAVNLILSLKPLANLVMRNTHGKPFA